jgi:hypothetical protein
MDSARDSAECHPQPCSHTKSRTAQGLSAFRLILLFTLIAAVCRRFSCRLTPLASAMRILTSAERQVDVRLQLNVRELRFVAQLDENHDQQITPEELQSAFKRFVPDLLKQYRIGTDQEEGKGSSAVCRHARYSAKWTAGCLTGFDNR